MASDFDICTDGAKKRREINAYKLTTSGLASTLKQEKSCEADRSFRELDYVQPEYPDKLVPVKKAVKRAGAPLRPTNIQLESDHDTDKNA